MMRLVAIGGEPATGKTTIMCALLEELGPSLAFESKPDGAKTRVFGRIFEAAKVIVLGSYDPRETFPGTDRFSMACQPDVLRFLEGSVDSGMSVVFEGDRLFNGKFVAWALAHPHVDLSLFVIDADEDVKAARHINRGDTQKANWLKGRATKVEGVFAATPELYRARLSNNTSEDLVSAVARIRAELLGSK